MKCILNYCGGSISLHCNFWHVILDAWPRELDWELVSSKITELMSPYRILVKKTFVSCMYLAFVC